MVKSPISLTHRPGSAGPGNGWARQWAVWAPARLTHNSEQSRGMDFLLVAFDYNALAERYRTELGTAKVASIK
jgi:hypothetical protein